MKHKATRNIPIVFWISAAAILFLGLEIALRVKWGFGTMLLFNEDPAFEYIAQPNQHIVRLGNRMSYNDHSMRSDALSTNDSCVVIGFGDSVINGGTLTDQDSLATTLIENSIGNNTRILNVSAGSWGPDNCAAYLNKYGDFNATLFVLVVSSHDAHDNMEFDKVVGNHPSYPNKQYPLATLEILDRYILPRIAGYLGKANEDNLMINKDGGEFNIGFEFFKNYSRDHNIPLLIYLHAEQQEIAEGKYNEDGQEIIRFCESNNIPYILGLTAGETQDLYVDQIHFNNGGQKLLAKALLQRVQEYTKNCH
jgi:hypothetical protein